jgi:hypothetical protein
MRNFNFWNLFSGRKPIALVGVPEDYEEPSPTEPFYRREAPQSVPGNDEHADTATTADVLEKLDRVVAQMDEIKGELSDLNPEERASVHDTVTRKAFNLIVSVTPPIAPANEAPKDEPEEDEPEFSDEHRAKVAKLYESISDDMKEGSKFIDQHWRKLCALADMLKPEEDESANPVGLLLADVAEAYIQRDEQFSVLPELAKLAKLAGYRKSNKGCFEEEADEEECHA